MAAEAVKEAERVSKLAEETDSLLLLAKEIFEKCMIPEFLNNHILLLNTVSLQKLKLSLWFYNLSDFPHSSPPMGPQHVEGSTYKSQHYNIYTGLLRYECTTYIEASALQC